MTMHPTKPILVVDDEPIVLATVAAHLNKLGWADVDCANDPETALGLMEQRPYQLVIFDWHMEPWDGHEFLRRVRAHEGLEPVRLLLMTTDSDFDTIRTAQQEGAAGFILKPFSRGTLKERLDSL